MKKRVLSAVLLTIFTAAAFAQSGQDNLNIYVPGETFVYSVKWTFIRVGTITLRTSPYPGNTDLIKVSMTVESNPAIFFVSVKEYNETVINIKTGMSERFYGRHKDGAGNIIINSEYDSVNRTGVYTVFNDQVPEQVRTDTIYNCEAYVDGPSLFFLTRALSGSSGVFNIPTMIEAKIFNTKLEFKGERKAIDVKAFPGSLSARKFHGNAEWKGGTAQGLSGEFSGWVSDDISAIVLYSEVDVLLGSVKIELERITKSNLVQFVKTNQKN
jgi:hypothetical protein